MAHNKANNFFRLCFFSYCLGFILLLSPGATNDARSQQLATPENAEERAKTAKTLREFLELGRLEAYQFQKDRRTDPFLPFITQEMLEAEARKSTDQLTGMRRFEPGQLVVVAIAFTAKDTFAMVQDSTGKGYIVRKGMKIGRRGEIIDIVRNKIIVKQPSPSLTSAKRYKFTEMLLKKEGEK